MDGSQKLQLSNWRDDCNKTLRGLCHHSSSGWDSGDLWKGKRLKQWVGGEQNLPGDLCRGARLRGAFRTWKKCENQRLQSFAVSEHHHL